MQVRERLLVSFGLKPSEGWPVLLLMLLSFCQGWALVLTDTAALTLLLDGLGAGALANTYLMAAAVVPLVGLLISWVGAADRHRTPGCGHLFCADDCHCGVVVLCWPGHMGDSYPTDLVSYLQCPIERPLLGFGRAVAEYPPGQAPVWNYRNRR